MSFTLLSPTAILGYGFPEASFFRGLEFCPDLIAVDAGSIDPGPFYLGSGKSFTDRAAVKRDLSLILTEGLRRNIPVIIGSAGGAGAKPHLHWCRAICQEIAQENHLSFKLGLIHADIPKEAVLDGVSSGKTKPLAQRPDLTVEDVESTNVLVAQMGVEPIQEAIKQQCQVILAGRAYDPAVFAALPILQGYDPGLALHLGKILECAAIAATPGSGSDCALGILERDCFVLKALSSERKFTKESVAAHSLYEKSNPVRLPGPGGDLDLSQVQFKALGQGEVEVRGSRFCPTDEYWIKLEGVRRIGFRTISISGTRDPILIASIDDVVEQVQSRVYSMLNIQGRQAQIHVHLYGKNGVMGGREPFRGVLSHELGIVLDVVGVTQEDADTACSLMRSTLMHYGYEGRISTAGNLAFPFSPSDTPMGSVFEFSIYHLLQANAHTYFPVAVEQIQGEGFTS